MKEFEKKANPPREPEGVKGGGLSKFLPMSESAYRRLLSERPLCEVAVQRLAALLEKDDPRAAFDVLVTHARALPPSEDSAKRLVSHEAILGWP